MNDNDKLSVRFNCNLSYNINLTKEQVDGCIKLAFEKFDEYLLSAVFEMKNKTCVLNNQPAVDEFKQKENLIKEKFKDIFTLLYQVDGTCDDYEIIAYIIFHYAVEDYIRLNIETLMHDSDMCKKLIVRVKDMDIVNK